jgi:hypothetical protein
MNEYAFDWFDPADQVLREVTFFASEVDKDQLLEKARQAYIADHGIDPGVPVVRQKSP